MANRVDGIDRYVEIPEGQCEYGYGVRNLCLDPFYTLAADLTIYQPGDVIYMPALRNLALPDGSKHSGFLIVADQGRNITGAGRFDFFTGFMNWTDPNNSFANIQLSDKATRLKFIKITGTSAEHAKAARNFR